MTTGKNFLNWKRLEIIMNQFMKDIPPHMKQEEEIFFPYIKQIHHAYKHRESYARLLIRTLRKPIEEVMIKEHEITGSSFTSPEKDH